MKRYLFFRPSRSAYQQTSDLFDFVWPTAAALWNLRWQVAGFAAVQPSVAEEVLESRFIAGSGIRGANLKRACIETTWDEQKSQFAKFLLVDLFAIFEGWLAKVLGDIGHSSLYKQLQFPTELRTGGPYGVGPALAQIKAHPSPLLISAFHAGLVGHPKNSLLRLENLLIVYRCFKELRNALMHNGGLADQRAVDAYVAYSALTAANIGVKELPEAQPISLGTPVKLSLRGVVGFGDVILRLIATLDAEFATAQSALKEFREQWMIRFTELGRTKPTRLMLPTASAKKRSGQIRMRLSSLSLPRPIDTGALDTYLKEQNFIF